eukprot:Skav229868  [mRNA]  locus=scaffold247:62822:91019:+ [translate_table: standard]
MVERWWRDGGEMFVEGATSLAGSMREYLPAENILLDHASKQRIRKHPKAGPTPSVVFSGLDIEDMAVFQKTTKGNRPKKSLGFLEVDRGDLPKRGQQTGVSERVADFQEILAKKDEAKQGAAIEVAVQTQASRCMDCGTPFCHQSVTDKSGCPLGNLIPEWNDLVRKGAWYDAFKRLMSTNNFPEFTGRVCPAPCEGACTLGIIDDPVSIKSVELTIIDKAYEMGWMKPCPPQTRTEKRRDQQPSGATVQRPGCGLAAADQLNKMGHRVTVLERSDRIGGGLMMYGVPNMKTDKVDVVERRVNIMKREGVNFICGPAGRVAESAQEAGAPGQALLDGGDVSNKWRRWWGAKKTGPEPKGSNGSCGDTGNDCIGTAVRQGAKSVINLELMPQPPKTRSPNNPWPHWPLVFKALPWYLPALGLFMDQLCVDQWQEFLDDGNGNLKGIKMVNVRWEKIDGQMRHSAVGTGTLVVRRRRGLYLCHSPAARQDI